VEAAEQTDNQPEKLSAPARDIRRERSEQKGARLMDPSRFATVLERTRQGDDEAARELVEEFEPEIKRQIRAMLRYNRLSQVMGQSDIYQSVMARLFIKLYAGKYEFENVDKLIGLIKVMVRNRVRCAGRFWTAGNRDQGRTTRPDPEHPIDPPATGQSPSQVAIEAEMLEEVQRRLSPQERRILELRRQEVPWKEIATEVGGNSDAVRRSFDRAVTLVLQDLGLLEVAR
jgi:RNA polymerase sigma factor (sigma-70 family)